MFIFRDKIDFCVVGTLNTDFVRTKVQQAKCSTPIKEQNIDEKCFFIVYCLVRLGILSVGMKKGIHLNVVLYLVLFFNIIVHGFRLDLHVCM